MCNLIYIYTHMARIFITFVHMLDLGFFGVGGVEGKLGATEGSCHHGLP